MWRSTAHPRLLQAKLERSLTGRTVAGPDNRSAQASQNNREGVGAGLPLFCADARLFERDYLLFQFRAKFSAVTI